MTWIRFPINVVVIHRADHVSVQKRHIDRIGLEPGHERSRAAPACGTAAHGAIVLQQNFRVILLAATESATDGVERDKFCRLDLLWRKASGLARAGPLRECG